MRNVIFNLLVWLRRRPFFRVSERTLMMLMPLAIIGSVFQFLWKSVFSPDSLISNIFYFQSWLPDQIFNAAWYSCQGMTQVIFGTFGIFTAYFAAQYTARFYKKDAQMAGVAGMLALLLCAYRFRDVNNFQFTFNWRLLSIHSFLFALIIGYVTGLIFRWLGRDFRHSHFEDAQRIRQRAINSFKPMIVSWLIGLFFGIIASIVGVRMMASNMYQFFQSQGQNNLNLWEYLPLIGLALFLNWLGIGQALQGITNAGVSGVNNANLNYALEHGSSWNIPNKYVGASLYQSYGQFGGSGITLGLLIVIILLAKNSNMVRISRWTIIQTLFGSDQGALIGLPIILNPLFLLPYIFLPLLNMIVAAGAIFLHLMPASAYIVLTGTPGPIKAFMATNGSWQSLVIALLIFGLDIVLYIPIVKIAEDVQNQIDQMNIKEAGEINA